MYSVFDCYQNPQGEFLTPDGAYHRARDYSLRQRPCVVKRGDSVLAIGWVGKLYRAIECDECSGVGTKIVQAAWGAYQESCVQCLGIGSRRGEQQW